MTILVPRVSMHGVDISGPSTARNRFGKRAPAGLPFYDEDMARLLVQDPRAGGPMGVDGAIVNDTTAASIYFADHFKATTISSAYDKTKGSDPQAVAFAYDSTIKSGAVKGTTGDAGSGAAADAITLALNNPLQIGSAVAELSASLLLSAWTNVYFFIGFTDVLPGSTLELPISLSGTTFTTTATDAVGFMFDTAATTDTIRLTGVANDVDAAHVDTGIAPSGSAFLDFHLRLEGSTAYFSIAGQTFSGANYLESAVRTSVNLYPIVCVCARTTTTRDATIDFLRGGKFAA